MTNYVLKSSVDPYLYCLMVFTALCHSKSSVRLSVHLWRSGMFFTQVVILRKQFHGRIALKEPAHIDPNMCGLVQREHHQNYCGIEWCQEHKKPAISPKRCKIEPRLLWRTNRKSHTCFQLVPKSMTLDDFEQQKRHSCRNKVVLRSLP